MSATTPHAARPTRRRPASRPPRRVSGPARPASRNRPPAGGAVAATPPFALRLGRRAARVVDARFLDRLLRGRVWIAILALGLMGIVFIQVSMLRLNAGISRGITSAETLHRQNATLRGDLSKLDASERIADAAKSFGMIQPAAGSVHYLDARTASAAAAARRIRPPKEPVAPAPPPAAQTPPAATTTAAPTTTATAATATTTTAAAATATTTTAPSTTTTTAAPVQQQTTPTQAPVTTTAGGQ